jgi:ammonium transporter, Amt family
MIVSLLTRLRLTAFVVTVGLGFLIGSSSAAFPQENAPAEAAAVVVEPVTESTVDAVDVASTAETSAAPEYYEKKEIDYTINTLIMFLCAVLVLLMQAGFAMVEVGMNAAKNAVNILFKNLMDLAIGVILFLLVGYGLMYPGGDSEGKWFGG